MQRPGRASLLSVLSVVALGAAACGSGSDRQARTARSPYYESAVPQPRAGTVSQGNQARPGSQAPAPPVVDLWVVPGGEAQAEEASYNWERVDDAYMNALKGFREEVSDIVSSGEELERTRKALHLLAGAIEKVPGGNRAELAATADQIRNDAAQLSIPRQERAGQAARGEAQGQQRRTLKDALGSAAEQLVELAEGPYRADPNVLEAARSFEAAAEAIAESDIIWTNNSAAYRAFQQAELALRSLGTAVASGRVSVGSATP